MNLYFASIVQMKKMLENLDKWLGAASAHADTRKMDPNVLIGLRLVADQYPFIRQVQSACDSAKFAAARLAGKEPPAHPDTEETLEDARKRIRTCVDYLGTFQEKDFEGAESRKVGLPFMPGKFAYGGDYLVDMAIPNFYFHVTTAYAILRKNGVDIGKMDFLGSFRVHDL